MQKKGRSSMAGANCRGAELDLEEKMEHFNLRFLVSQEIE